MRSVVGCGTMVAFTGLAYIAAIAVLAGAAMAGAYALPADRQQRGGAFLFVAAVATLAFDLAVFIGTQDQWRGRFAGRAALACAAATILALVLGATQYF